MFLERLARLLRKTSRSTSQTTGKVSANNSSTQNTVIQERKRVDPAHIGDLGEFKVNVQLRQFEKGSQYLTDLLLPNSRSKTGYSQIDHVLVTQYAIFVIETKNYDGTIRGKRMDKYWQVNGKFSIYNPLRQNYGHIKTLQEILKEFSDIDFVSIVSFTKRCKALYIDQELRNIEANELVVYDIKLTDIIDTKLRKLSLSKSSPPLSQASVERIVEIISMKNITDPQIRVEHVNRITKSKNH